MKKYFILLFIVLLCFTASAQQVVFDPALFYESIKQTYYDIQALDYSLQSIQQLYEVATLQAESIKKLDPTSFKKIDRYIQDRKDGTNSLYYRMGEIGIEFGDLKYHLKDVMPSREEINKYMTELNEARKEGDEEKEIRIFEDLRDKDGKARNLLTYFMQKALALSQDTDTQIADSEEAIADLMGDIKGNESITSQLQIGNLLLIETSYMLKRLVETSSTLNEMYAANTQIQNLESELKQKTSLEGTIGINSEPDKEFFDYVKNMETKNFNPINIFRNNR